MLQIDIMACHLINIAHKLYLMIYCQRHQSGKKHILHREDATILPDMADNVDSPGIWSYIKQNKIKSIAGIGAAIGIGSILFSDDTEQASIDRRNAEAATSLEKSLKIYNTIPQYHGSGFANWNEKTKHHYY